MCHIKALRVVYKRGQQIPQISNKTNNRKNGGGWSPHLRDKLITLSQVAAAMPAAVDPPIQLYQVQPAHAAASPVLYPDSGYKNLSLWSSTSKCQDCPLLKKQQDPQKRHFQQVHKWQKRDDRITDMKLAKCKKEVQWPFQLRSTKDTHWRLAAILVMLNKEEMTPLTVFEILCNSLSSQPCPWWKQHVQVGTHRLQIVFTVQPYVNLTTRWHGKIDRESRYSQMDPNLIDQDQPHITKKHMRQKLYTTKTRNTL